MRIIAYLDVPAEPGETSTDVRDRAERILECAGLHNIAIEVVTETAVITNVAEEKPKPRQRMSSRVYQSPLYPGTDEFHEFYIEKHLT